jgi:L-lactate dehydrogenase complex protein LldG
MIATFVEGLRADDCTVLGPFDADAATRAVLARVDGVAACNADVPVPQLRAQLTGVLTPDDAAWRERLPSAAVGITGAHIAVADPATIALAAAPGSPRATSLVPPRHLCVVRVSDVVPSLADAMARLGAKAMPSALTWIGGPSRTGDLEMIITLGVHGPRAVDVILLDE